MKVCFETFGCRLNKAEALQMEADYLAKGWELTGKHSDADLFVVRGCSVTSRAQRESEKLIAHLKRHYPTKPIRVCGCLAPDIDAANIRAVARKAYRSQLAAPGKESIPTRTARAYLKVQDGCSGKCAFCIVPKFRGSSVSESFMHLLDKARRFIDAGYHEIVITGCNLTLYASEGKRLPELVAALAGMDANCRVRIGSVEPGACALETVAAMSEAVNICRFLHIPIQSGSNQILTAMKRPYLVRDVEALVEKATRLMPQLGLGCDLMTGFPSETELDFQSTVALLKRMPFNNAHVFPFSTRPGTAAASMTGRLPKDIRTHRAHELSRLVESMRHRFALSFIGKTVEIVVEDERCCRGWTSEYLRCEASGNVPRKATASILVTRSADDALFGRIVSGDRTKQVRPAP